MESRLGKQAIFIDLTESVFPDFSDFSAQNTGPEPL
jgi:hypothetical protein